jgi:hypothetical protein
MSVFAGTRQMERTSYNWLAGYGLKRRLLAGGTGWVPLVPV